MMISGILAISIAFIAAAVSTAAYWLYYREQDDRFYQLANIGFAVMSVSLVFSAVLLYINIFAHNFQLNYVYSYTSSKLSAYYLISTFWAGQEGTFLLWLVFGVVYGLVLIKTIARKQPLVMFYMMLVQLFLLLILLKKSPFTMIWNVHTEVPVGFMPSDGAGLNPLLQNPWMIIHPPIMFIGYSSTMVVFALVLNAMHVRDLLSWIKNARPWVIFSTLMLGTGIILGGYWSYVTLGWGGYWAWDPVENASLVPWLFAIVLLHGLIIQSRQKGLVKTNLVLAGLTFIAVLWGSFLTRSGVLADFSVHSFAESDLNIYLMAFVGLFAGIFLYLFFRTFRLADSPKFAEGILSRETFILVGMMSVLLTGIVVFLGTSSPIYTGLLGKPSNVSAGFYNTVSIPAAIFLLLSMAIAPILAWKVSELRNKKSVLLSAVAALLVTILGVVLGLTKIISIVLIYLSTFTVFLNGYVAVSFLKKHPRKSGAYLAHIGVALMIIGIITSSMYDSSEKVTLPVGEYQPTQFGYEIEFSNFFKGSDGKERAKLFVRDGDKTYQADPQFYYSNYTKSYMLSPHVTVGFLKDVYISPISFLPAQYKFDKSVTLTKSESKKVGDIRVTFNRFIVGNHIENSPMTVKADVTVEFPRGEVSVQPAMWMQDGKRVSDEVEIPQSDYRLKIESIDASSGSVTLALLTAGEGANKPKDILAIEVSEKPLISLLWIGTLFVIFGVLLTLVDRVKPAK